MTSSAETPAKCALGFPWQQVGMCGRAELAKAKSEIMNLIQWLARVANSYVRASPPGRRTELEFLPARPAFVTKPFGKDISLELLLPSLEMQFFEDSKPAPHILDPDGHSPAEVEAWILVELLHRGIDREKFSKRLPYSTAGMMSGDAQEHSPQSCRRGLEELSAWFCNAAGLLDAAARATGDSETRIICLPHMLALTCAAGRDRQLDHFGFLPGDATDPEPFFYVYPHDAVMGRRTILSAAQLLLEPDPAAAGLRFLVPAAA